MATPHCIGWRRAHKALPKEIRDKIISAYEAIHRQGVLHGQDALDLSESDVDTKIDARSTRFEIPVDKRNDPTKPYPRIQASSAPVLPRVEVTQSASGTEKVQEKANTSHTSSSPVKAESHTHTEPQPRIRAPKPVRPHSETTVSIPVHEAWSSRATHGSPSPPPRARAPASPPPTPPDVIALSVPPPSYKWVDRSTYDGDAPCTRDLLPDSWIPLPKKRSFDVAFHPDTVDNGFWANGREPKKHIRRPPTPFIASEQAPKDDVDADSEPESEPEAASQPQLLQAEPWEQDVNPREPPPYRDASRSPTTQDKANPQPPVEDADEVRIVITSPTGQRRVWGVPETMATKISMLLDQRADRLLAHRTPQQAVSSSSTTKRKADQMSSQEEGSSKSKLLKTTHSLFSRFFG
ncbi:hypothetical protein EIP86_008961 [Pleurotus ostreatoroseus]|nr:hypothetical protein EIP86_008961 [Pleurotus ostreatoroseus]